MKVGTDAMILGAIATVEKEHKILDIGAGTGVLSLMLAQKASNLKITSLEYDENALIDLKVNVFNAPFDSNFTIEAVDFNLYATQEKFDTIISNPPFYKDSFTKTNNSSRSKARNEENLSFELLLSRGGELLTNEGLFWFIVPYSYGLSVDGLISINQLFIKDKVIIKGKESNPNRIIYCVTKSKIEKPLIRTLTIRQLNGKYTQEYIELTREYHDRKLD